MTTHGTSLFSIFAVHLSYKLLKVYSGFFALNNIYSDTWNIGNHEGERIFCFKVIASFASIISYISKNVFHK